MHAVTVEIANIQLGIDVQEVQEVWRVSEVLKVPRSPEMIIGLINRRGAVVTLVHGHHVLGFPEPARERDAEGRLRDYEVVILEHGGEQIAIAVSRLVDTIEVEPQDLLPIPPTLHQGAQRIATSVHAGQDKFTVIVSAEKIFDYVRAATSSPQEEP